MNDIQKQYFSEIKHLLPCSAKQKKRCIMELEDSVYSFTERNPNAELNDLYNAFGAPNSIAEAFLERISPDELSQRLSVKRRIVTCAICAIAILSIVVATVVISRINKLRHYHDGYSVETFFESSPNTSPSVPPVETY